MEPMTLGSPVSSPGSNQSQYLPPFLMGDPQNMTPHNNTLSPKTVRSNNLSFGGSPNNNTPETGYHQMHTLNRSALGPRTLFNNNVGGGGGGSGSGGGAANSAHQVGPPKLSLFDSLRNEHSKLGMSPLNGSNYSLNQNGQSPTTQPNDSYGLNPISASMRGLCSPMSPYPRVNIADSPQAVGGDFWVTIFGYAPGSSSMILQHFTICGTIVNVVHAPQNGNWMHVRYASRIECDKALNYNFKVLAGNVMVGVTRCLDTSIIDKENNKLAASNYSPAQEPYKPKVRPLVQQSYNMAHKEISIVPEKNVPQKSTGLVNKALDLIFGR